MLLARFRQPLLVTPTARRAHKLMHVPGRTRNISTSLCWQLPKEQRYIQTSRVPTLHFQPSLPHLPIPVLADTCLRYLDAVRPVVSSEQFQTTEAIVREFGREGGVGEKLDKSLRQQDAQNKGTSYIAQPWYHMYLSSRKPLVLNYNPFMAWKQDPRTPEQVDRAVNIIRAAVLFHNALADSQLEPEVFHLNPQKSDTELFRNMSRLVPSSLAWYVAYLWKAFPLDMSQYSRLFCSTRLPRQHCDELVSYPGQGHVVVMRNGHMYCLQAMLPNGLPVDAEELHSQLQWIVEQDTPPPSHPVSYLTTADRDEWAKARQELEGVSEANRHALWQVDSALMVLCLDDKEVTEPVDATHTLLHNYGSDRWFDKSLNLIVTKNGLSAVNFEHAWGDGVAVLRFFNEVYKHTTNKPYIPESKGVKASCNGVNLLEFQLTESLQAAIQRAREELTGKCQSLSVNPLEYDCYGANLIKQSGIRPDAFFQLALQVAYYRQYKELVPSYESCSTAAFRHGRTETIRPASSAAKSCAKLMEKTHPAGVEVTMAAVREATDAHFELTRNAAMGQGFDRHLFALQCLAEAGEGGQGSLDIFQDPSYQYLNRIILSTSTLSADTVLIGGFGPVIPDGYAVGYTVNEDFIGSNILSYPARDGAQLRDSLAAVLDDLHCLMAGKNFK